MRKLIKTLAALCGVFMLSAAGASAQKFGYVDAQQILMQMPEVDSLQSKLQSFFTDLNSQLETMQVEYNKKLDEYQKATDTLSDAVKRDRERELQSLLQRIQEFQQQAQLDIQAKEQELTKPLMDKIEEAIAKISKANNIAAVFNVNVLEYFDPSALVDVTSMVKAELNIK